MLYCVRSADPIKPQPHGKSQVLLSEQLFYPNLSHFQLMFDCKKDLETCSCHQDVIVTLSGISWNHLELHLAAVAGPLHLLVKDLSSNGALANVHSCWTSGS